VLAPSGGGAGDLAITPGQPPTQRLHIGFYVPSTDLVHAFWEAGRAAGYQDDGEPGPRPQYGDDYYGGFLLDPDGNSVEAMTHDAPRTQGQIDHLWLRVEDVAAARDEHRPACEAAGFALSVDTPELVQFRSPGASFSFVAGEPTRHVDLGFLAID
jgi:catechol 2,3-dioxygenase-like lactoylglutathione lyase family enzyme